MSVGHLKIKLNWKESANYTVTEINLNTLSPLNLFTPSRINHLSHNLKRFELTKGEKINAQKTPS